MTGAASLELEARRRVYRFVEQHPACYLREMQRALGMGMGTLEFHLRFLEEHGLIVVAKEENKRFFPAGISPPERRFLALLRMSIPRQVVLLLAERGAMRHADIAAALRVRPSTLAYQLQKLRAAALLTARRDGRETFYALADPQGVARLLVRYRASLLDRMVDGFLDGFDRIGP